MVAYATIITEVLRFVKERAGGTEKAGGQAAGKKQGSGRGKRRRKQKNRENKWGERLSGREEETGGRIQVGSSYGKVETGKQRRIKEDRTGQG